MKKLLAILSILLAGCVTHEPPCGLNAYWAEEQVNLMPPADPLWFAAVERAATTWNDAIGAEVFVIDDQHPAVPILLVPNLGTASQQAITTIKFTKPLILEAIIKINTMYMFSFMTPNYYEVDAESLVLHELGHVLGMPHRNDPTSVMYEYLSGGQVRRIPSQDDVEQVQCAYGGRR